MTMRNTPSIARLLRGSQLYSGNLLGTCLHPHTMPNVRPSSHGRQMLSSKNGLVLATSGHIHLGASEIPWWASSRPNQEPLYCTASVETLPIHTRFEPQRSQDAERKGRATPSQARFWSVSRVGRLLLSWTSLGGFEKPQQARGWWSNALEIRQGKSQFQVRRKVPLVGPPVGCGSHRFPDPHGA